MSQQAALPKTVPVNPATLREMRKLAKMSAKLLAERAGITAAYLCQIEKGRRNPSPEVAGRLADGLGVSISSLFSSLAQLPSTGTGVG